jgi:hypothetical protein
MAAVGCALRWMWLDCEATGRAVSIARWGAFGVSRITVSESSER